MLGEFVCLCVPKQKYCRHTSLDYHRAPKGAYLCIQNNKKKSHLNYIIRQNLYNWIYEEKHPTKVREDYQLTSFVERVSMFSLIFGFKHLFRIIRQVFQSEEGQAILASLASLLVLGTVFYTMVEKLAVLDSLYLSFTTLTTIGYGDFTPKTALGKIFTMIYGLLGLGIVSLSLGIIAKEALALQKQRKKQRRTKQK